MEESINERWIKDTFSGRCSGKEGMLGRRKSVWSQRSMILMWFYIAFFFSIYKEKNLEDYISNFTLMMGKL